MLEELRDGQFGYVTTTGRRTRRPHEIEIWFVVLDDALFLMAGGGESSDWVKNIRVTPEVAVRIGTTRFEGLGDVAPPDVDQTSIRRAMAAKYQGWEVGADLSEWAQTALVVRIRLAER